MSARVLAIEANDTVRNLICECLRREGYEVLGVRHGVEAILQLRHTLPDLLLIDQDVPAGGVRTARILRLNPKIRPVPVLVTVLGERSRVLSLIHEAQSAGIDSFLAKPYTPSLLAERVAKELAKPSRHIQLNIVQIREEIQKLSELPAMPYTHGKVVELLGKEDEEVDVPQLIRLLESDPSLAAMVLKVARSASFGFGGSYVGNAVTFLGLKRLRPIIHSATVFSIFKGQEGVDVGDDFNVLDLWSHSVACGIVMGMLSREVRGRVHFLLGLLHDIGKLILNYRFTDYFTEVLRVVKEEKRSIYDVEKEILGVTHAEVGHVLAATWDLPPELVVSIAHHHRPSDSNMHKRLSALAHFADIAVRTMRIGSGGDPLIPEMDPYAKRLRANMEGIVSQREQIVQQVRDIVSARETEDA